MAFGFSKWSSNVDLNGTVSANGKWEVAVTAADASISNTGAEMKKINTESSYTVVTYPVYVDYRASSGYYSFRIGDDKAAETKISYNDFMTNYEKNTAKWIGVSKFDSGAKSGNYTFMLNVAGEYLLCPCRRREQRTAHQPHGIHQGAQPFHQRFGLDGPEL